MKRNHYDLRKIIKLSISATLSLSVSTLIAGTVNISADKPIYNTKASKRLHQYMQKQLRFDRGQLAVDLSDPLQYQFVLHRIKASKNTRDNSPQLYKMLEQLRQKHIRIKESGGVVAIKQENEITNTNDHSIFGVYPQKGVGFPEQHITKAATKNDGKIKSLASHARSSVYGGTSYTLVDNILYDTDYNQLGSMGAKESFGEGKGDFASSYIDVITMKQNPDVNLILSDSMTIVERADGEQEVIYKSENFIPPRPDQYINPEDEPNPDLIPKYTHIAPKDRDDDDDEAAIICLNRQYEDCDIGILDEDIGRPNADTLVRLPIAGSLQLPHEVRTIYGFGDSHPGVTAETEVRISTRHLGGSTMLNPGNDKEFRSYINEPIVNYDRKISIIEWNVPRKEGIFGNVQLFNRFQDVSWWTNIVVNMRSYFGDNPQGGRPPRFANALITIYHGTPGQTNFNFPVEPLQFAYSCIAKGTQIKMADGKSKRIEHVEEGDKVVANGLNMIVADTSIGMEAIPMVSLLDEKGRQVTLTETHPVLLPGRNIVWAKEVQEGDLVMTESGPSRIKMVKHTMFDDEVYNLKLKALHGDSKVLAHDANAFYANGFLVGDLAMQSEYSYKDQQPLTEEQKLKRIPERWKKDYLLSESN